MTPEVQFYLKLLVRRLPAMMVLFLIATSIGVVMAMRLPTLYDTRATLLVERAQIPEEMLRSGGIQLATSQQLEIIRQQLLTRANLIDVARNNRVFPNQSRMSPDEVVREMRSRTRLQVRSGRDRATLMYVSFEGPDPEQVASVANEYVTLILAANTELRAERAEGALAFFEQEVETLTRDLDAQSRKIAEFRRENADALPDNLSYRQGRQSLLQERLARVEREIDTLQRQRENVQEFYENTGQLSNPDNSRQTPEQRRLRELQGQLRVALAVYSEENPRVRLLRNQISGLEAEIQEALRGAASAGEEGAVSALDASLVELDTQLNSLREDRARTEDELIELEASINRTPANEITLEAMIRDQQNLRSLYTGAVQRLSQARISERVELSARGERITVLEPASIPGAPSSPNRPLVMGAGVAVGTGLAVLLFVVLELLNQSIRRPADIVRGIEVTPLATLPRFETTGSRRRRRLLQIISAVVTVVVVLGGLWAVDQYYRPLDQIFAQIVDRLL